jgi:Nucleoside-diphosphate-sugar epimerases
MILLTGSSGFLGKIILAELQNQRFDVLTLGRSAENKIKCDLSSSVPVIPLVDQVIHVAGKAHVLPSSPRESREFFDVNVRGTKNLLEGLENHQTLKQFIFISSVAVYGLTEGNNIREEMPLLAKDPYGKSKIETETLIIKWCLEHNVSYYIFRLPLIAGPHPPGNLRDMVNAIKKGRYMSIGKGSAKKSMVLAKDVARFLPTVQGPQGIYHLTDGHHPSFRELEKKIVRNYGKKNPPSLPLAFVKILSLAGDFMGKKFPLNSGKLKKIISTLTFDDNKARKLLYWNSKQVLTDWEIE